MTSSGSHDSGTPFGHVAEWESRAVDYLADRLAADERESVEAHLAACAPCREEIAHQRAVTSLLRSIAPVPPPAATEAAVLRAFARLHPAFDVDRTEADDDVPARVPRSVATAETGWWSRLIGFLDRPKVRRLAPALAAGLILVVSLVGLAQLAPGDLTKQTDSVTTTVAAAQAETTTEAFSAAGGVASTDSRDASVEGDVSGTQTTLANAVTSDSGPASTMPGGVSADTLATVTASTAGGLTATTTAGGGEVITEGAVEPPVAVPVVYVTVTTGETTAEADDLVEWTTGLSPLPSALWLGAPTYATYMPAVTLETMTAELAAQGVRLSVSSEPPPGTSTRAASIPESDLPTQMLGSAPTGEGPSSTPTSPGRAQSDLVLVVVIAR